MDNLKIAMQNLNQNVIEQEQKLMIPFDEFLQVMADKPSTIIRNVLQVFHDMIKKYVGSGIDEYSDDPESIRYVFYDCNPLLVEGTDQPFFADRLFANRFIDQVEALRHGAQQNKIYIFEGPPGCGKSTFLNNLLMKFEDYTNTDEGLRYETVWRLNRIILGSSSQPDAYSFLERNYPLLDAAQEELFEEQNSPFFTEDYIEIPCPSHDNPILMIPKKHRRPFLDDLLKNDQLKWKIFTDKEYNWVFKDNACTICSALYQALLDKLQSPRKVFSMLYARPYKLNRRQGEGISVFNPGDKPLRQNIMTNKMLQKRINAIFRDSNQVKYVFSHYAKTNNGIYALMDIKSHNTERLIELHNIISDGIHKVEDIEENVDSLFLALMNPEDKLKIQDIQSFSDRIEYVNLLYVLDLRTEIEIYRNIFGKHIDEMFLPRVLHNFARVIISSRLNSKSEALLEWVLNPKKYTLYCDENLLLLKMEIYTGHIPKWLTEDDHKRFTAKRRRKIIAESESEGRKGFSGRDSIKIFNDFYSRYAREDKLIDMSILHNYFTKVRKDLNQSIPSGFMDSMMRMYDYSILQEVKESLYYYNEKQISKDIQNYLFAINFEIGAVETCTFTGEKLEITEDFFQSIENRLIDINTIQRKRLAFRLETQKEYAAKTLTQEIINDGKNVEETQLFISLREKYIFSLKEKVLDPFIKNENFRRAIKDYGTTDFKTYDKRIRNDVQFLIKNLVTKYQYNQQGAKGVCIYAIERDLTKKFPNK